MIFAFGAVIFLLSYTLTRFISHLLSIQDDVSIPYQFKKDPYIYIFLILAVLFGAVYFLNPYFKDAVCPPHLIWLGTSFVFAGLIYLLFLLETDKLLDTCVVIFSILSTFLFADKSALADLAPVPWWLSALGVGLTVSLITLGSRVLAGLTGVFSLVMSMLSLGLFLTSCFGGTPSYLGLMAIAMFGAFACIFQFNAFRLHLKINEGAMMSVTFLFCMLLLSGVNEFAGPSMLILPLYIIAELLWSLCAQYILRRKETDLCFNAIYWSAFQKTTDIGLVYTIIFKICIINIVLSCFQLYAQNAFTLPLLALIINFWLLSKLNVAGQEESTLKDINTDFVENIKTEIGDIKQHLGKKD